jgi:hypothetical protein
MSLAEYFESRKQECEEGLNYALTHPAVKIQQEQAYGGKRDATPEYIEGLRRAIADYREAAEIQRAVWQGASSRM